LSQSRSKARGVVGRGVEGVSTEVAFLQCVPLYQHMAHCTRLSQEVRGGEGRRRGRGEGGERRGSEW